MLQSYVVRVVAEARQRGVLAGEIRSVTTGRRRVFRDKDELVAALLDTRAEEDEAATAAQEGAS